MATLIELRDEYDVFLRQEVCVRVVWKNWVLQRCFWTHEFVFFLARVSVLVMSTKSTLLLTIIMTVAAV